MDSRHFTIGDLYFLMAFDERYRYVVRNKDGKLWVFEKEPVKATNGWMVGYVGQYALCGIIDGRVLRCVKWSDDRPVVIPPKKVIENAIAKRLSDAVVMCALFRYADTDSIISNY